MSIKTGCPHCGAELKLKSDQSVGRKVPCPKCRTPFVVEILDEPAAGDEWDNEEDDYSEEYNGGGRAAGSRSRPVTRRSSNSQRASGSRGKPGTKNRGKSHSGPNWILIAGGGISGVAILVIAAVLLWPSGGSAVNSGPDTAEPAALGPYVSFLNGKLQLQQPAGFEVVNPPGETVQGLEAFAGFGRRQNNLYVSITTSDSSIETLAESYTPENPGRPGNKVLSRTVETIDGKTDILVSAETQGTGGRFFNWTRLRGDQSRTIVLQALMPFDEQATYSKPFKEILQTAQFEHTGAQPETATASGLDSVLTETEVGGVKLVPKKFLDGRIEMLAPADFGPMSDEMIRTKYPSASRPGEILSDESGAVNLAFTYSPQQVSPDSLLECLPETDPCVMRV